ncbi:MAG: hypothetical protein NTX11_00195 [Candidatus Saccharibacteria bacterium]|nr:hypothetical protein [Candidatus Saccharibacteria bacterium]
MSSAEIVFVNAAIQNRDFSIDEKPEKVVGILAAQALNHLQGNDVDVHCWNNVGLFDSQQSESADYRLAIKYNSDFAKHIVGPGNKETVVLSDDQNVFTEWAIPTINSMISSGSVYIEEADFHHCFSCDTTIAELAVDIDDCKSCNSSSQIKTTTELGMFTNTPDDRGLLLPENLVINQINIRQERSSLMQIPPRLLLSRTRSIGVPLESFGLENHKLDPRLGIGLLAIFAASNLGYGSVGIVQSISTLNRVAPYLRSALPNPRLVDLPGYLFAFHSLVRPQLLDNAVVSPSLIALYALGQRNDITSTQKIFEEISKLERCVTALDKVAPLTETDRSSPRLPRNLSHIVATTAKDIGKLLEEVKHGRTPSQETLSEIDSARTFAQRILDLSVQ